MKFEDENKLSKFYSIVIHQALSLGIVVTPYQLGLSIMTEIAIIE